MMRNTQFLILCALLALGACRAQHDGGDDAVAAGDETSLPRPEATRGSVTGMPSKPGPGPIGAPVPASLLLPANTSVAAAGSTSLPNAVTVPEGAPPPLATDASAPEEPTPQDAVAVLRDYYGAIAAHEYTRAYTLWSDGGHTSGQTPQQFADGFVDTVKIDAQVGAPGRIDAAAGSRYVEIPVTLDATRRDGSVHRYGGSYVLRRAVVDGASAEQRAWRIASASLHEVR
jgi:hypothetical protein